MNKEEYVINLHILENCNFRCKYCFSHFNTKKLLTLEQWKLIVDNISSSVNVKRFNIAGGEPLLFPELSELIQYIYSKNIPVSIITNGSLLNESFIELHKDYIETIGISIDSFDTNTLYNLNCNTPSGKQFSYDDFKNIAEIIVSNNIKLKVNTVVSKENINENLSSKLNPVPIDRWKILKMKEFQTNNFDNSNLSVNNEEFDKYVNTNSLNKNNINRIVVEQSMVNSYILIDSNGHLLDNSSDKYLIVSDIKTESFSDGFKRYNLDKNLYQSRYK